MIGTPITIKNFDNGKQVIINDHSDPANVIALQSFPTFESDLNAQNTARSGSHGEIRLPYYYSGMSIVLQGVIVANTEAAVWVLKKKFDDVMELSRTGFPNKYTGVDPFPPMNNSTLRLSFTTPEGRVVFVDATPIKSVSYSRELKERYRLDFQVILRSSSPYLLIDPQGASPISGSLGSFSKGLKIPFKVPFNFNTQYVQNSLDITVATPSFAIIELSGSDAGIVVNPKITNLTNGTSVRILKSLLGSSNKFTINGVYKTMTDEGGKNIVPYSEGDYLVLEQGLNTLVYSADQLIPTS